MTTAGARWLLLGNSTRSEGYFYDAVHGKLKARKPGDTKRGMWSSYVIPSFASPFVEKSWVEEMKLTLGEDSDEYRIRVLGLPPRTDSQQFIPREMVTSAMDRRIDTFARWPLILGCDVGRGDRSVMLPRRGRKVLPNVQVFTGERTMDFAQRIANEIRFYRDEHDLKAQVILEELGMGVGVVETLEDMGYADQVWGVNTGASPSEGGKELYSNLRCEMWGECRTWLEGNVELPNMPDLLDDLVVIKRKPNANGKLRLETKDEMRRRGVRSPDLGDALALTFAVPFDLLPDRRSLREDAWGTPNQPAPSGQSWMSF
jgi:phage terminase large subunit